MADETGANDVLSCVLRRDHGNTPLKFAAALGQLEVIEALLAAGARPDVRNRWNLGAKDWAKRAGAEPTNVENALRKG